MKEDKVILSIEWKIEDIIEAMNERNIEPTQSNIELFLQYPNIKHLEEASIAAGWDVIFTILDNQ